MKIKLFVLLAVLTIAALALSACGGGAVTSGGGAPAASSSKGDAAKGKTQFASTCSACHGADAKGLPSLGKDLTTSTLIKGQTDAQLLSFLKTGRPANDPANTTKVDMPPKGGNPALTDNDLQDIIAFIRSVNK